MQIIKTSKKLGSCVRKTRKKQGLTQIELAGLCGVGVRFLGELERGKASCEIGKTLHVVNMLGIELMAANSSDE